MVSEQNAKAKQIEIQRFDVHIIDNAGQVLQTIPIQKSGTYSIGKAANCQISIDIPNLAEKQFVLKLESGMLTIADTSTQNSTVLVGQTLTSNKAFKLKADVNVEFGGDVAFLIEVEKYLKRSNDAASQHADVQVEPKTNTSAVLQKLKQKGEIVIGRSASSDVFIDSLQVSRRHAVIKMQNESSITIEDLNTTNGTYVNGVRIVGEVPIQLDDHINVGSEVFVLDGEVVTHENAIIAENIEKIYSGGYVGLHKLSIEVPSNQFVALMGPSGCGKSTLLKCLNGASPATSGSITIQGLVLNNANYNTLKKHIGYVPQDDVLHGQLSVERTLFYAAKLRMSGDVSNEEIDQKINQVLHNLNLDAANIKNNKVSELSGGQRKRISIAVELLNDPTILFLDEPTSPLDPETIEDFLSCIRELTTKGHTVIMVTHKPSDLDYVDKVIFLGKGGYLAYYGDKSLVAKYFDKQNFIEVYSIMKETEVSRKWYEKWLMQFPISDAPRAVENFVPKPETSILSQYFWLTMRYLNVKWNDLGNLFLLFSQPVIIGFMLVYIFKNLQINVLFMMSITAIWFGVSNASKEIVSELPIYERERMYNLNIANYILSKITVLSVIALIQSLIFVLIVYFAYQFRGDPVEIWRLGSNVSFVFFLSMSATLFGLLLSSVFNNAEKVMTVVPIVLIPQILLSGAIAKVDSSIKVILSYMTFGRWGTEGLANIQDRNAEELGHWADKDSTIPASIMQHLPKTEQSGSELNIDMVLQPQGAMKQLNYYDDKLDLISLFPQSLTGVMMGLMLLNLISFIGIYVALKRKDSKFS